MRFSAIPISASITSPTAPGVTVILAPKITLHRSLRQGAPANGGPSRDFTPVRGSATATSRGGTGRKASTAPGPAGTKGPAAWSTARVRLPTGAA